MRRRAFSMRASRSSSEIGVTAGDSGLSRWIVFARAGCDSCCASAFAGSVSPPPTAATPAAPAVRRMKVLLSMSSPFGERTYATARPALRQRAPLCLLPAHCHSWIDLRRAARRQPARADSDRQHHQRDTQQCDRVLRRHAEQQSTNETARENGAAHTDEQPSDQKDAALHQHHALHTTAVGAEAHSNPDLIGACADRERQHARDADGRDDHCEKTERRYEHGIEPPWRDALVADLRDGHHVFDWLVRRDVAHDARRRGREPARGGCRVDDQTEALEHLLLRPRLKHHRTRLGVEPTDLRVADDANNGAPVAAHTNEAQYVA